MSSIAEYIEILIAGRNLSREQAGAVLDKVFEGEVPQVQIAALLTALRMKEATAAEIAGFAGSLRRHAVRVKIDDDNLVDTCGTGGGAVKTFNISTAAALVAAGAGARVAKHGNRGITSKCGSADVLEALGVKIDAGAGVVTECIGEAGIGFMFAPMFHPAMKHVQPIRKSLGFRTVFNVLGPLANPAGAGAQVMGVADAALMETIAEALGLLGVRYALVVHSEGLDEISTAARTRAIEVRDGEVAAKEIDPTDYGIALCRLDELAGEDAARNAFCIREILGGRLEGPRKDIVVLNAAAAIIAAGLADDFPGGMSLARESIDSGAAEDRLEKLVRISNGNQR